MRRPRTGATRGPGPVRPGSGYGRRVGRPGPDPAAHAVGRAYRGWWRTATDLAAAVVAPAALTGEGARPEVLDRRR